MLLALQSLYLADGAPFALEERIINMAVVPDALDNDFSIMPPGSWLLHNVPWRRAQHRITAINADQTQADLLQVALGMACPVIERQTWRGQQCVTCVKQIFLGNSYDLIARFSPGAARPV